MSFIFPEVSACGLPPDYIFVANENGEIDAKLREWAVEAGKWAAETYLPQDPVERTAFLADLETSLTNTFKLEKSGKERDGLVLHSEYSFTDDKQEAEREARKDAVPNQALARH